MPPSVPEEVKTDAFGKTRVNVYSREEIIEPLRKLLPVNESLSGLANEAWITRLKQLKAEQRAEGES